MSLLVALAAAYLIGGIPTSYLASRHIAGIDLRTAGSGNLGATNLYRVLGWRYAVPVALVDIAKGAAPVLVFAPPVGHAPWIPLAVGGAAIAGHVFPVYLGFRGGKGVATAAGVVLALAPVAILVSLVVWVAVVKFSGYVSLASMAAAIVFPGAAWVLTSGDRWVTGLGATVALFILYTHRSNIRRLMAGTESRFGRGQAA